MRLAELVMAVTLALLSVYLMWKSAELPIGWTPGSGPGGGAFPFWLSAGMLASTLWIIVRWVRRSSPVSRSTETYMDSQTLKLFIVGAGSLTALIGSIYVIGIYGAIPLYLAFYMRYMGHHRWLIIAAVAIPAPIFTFFFFEIALYITLPKGMTEPWFYPLYAIFL
jgi:putative tricarboxylic transport membrane protein